ncbi:TPA: Asp-tRNA(Asn)/Glu-tRNA(Gln) amidotransferase GatCAB subunit A, partial [Candidatus Bipolaricaulota bacterium]|nr:Asp-tRNA(Asn)/Glu-tRNA(Gln) amidotransferase GatCAB subunit A [Candidatus Bipolaricaulota bacterium]
MNLAETLAALDERELALADVVSALWKRIEEREPEIHAFIRLADPEVLLRQGEKLSPRPLRGLPIAIKDNLTTVDLPTSCGSKILSRFRP